MFGSELPCLRATLSSSSHILLLSPTGSPVTVSLASPVTASPSTPAMPLLVTQTCPHTLRRAARRISFGSLRAASPVLSGESGAVALGVRFILLDFTSDGLVRAVLADTYLILSSMLHFFYFFVPSGFIFVYLGFRCTFSVLCFREFICSSCLPPPHFDLPLFLLPISSLPMPSLPTGLSFPNPQRTPTLARSFAIMCNNARLHTPF
ncbi:hypothetical protein F4604DRAFT_1923986 [Suillus subluteus]|nr:hypothetical protein F4604DRAFT_1923986 [Suillus subluteus]